MATTHKTINGIECNSADWANCERSMMSVNGPMDSLIQQILRHPMKDCISIPWVFSYNYQILRTITKTDVEYARTKACREVLQALNDIQ